MYSNLQRASLFRASCDGLMKLPFETATEQILTRLNCLFFSLVSVTADASNVPRLSAIHLSYKSRAVFISLINYSTVMYVCMHVCVRACAYVHACMHKARKRTFQLHFFFIHSVCDGFTGYFPTERREQPWLFPTTRLSAS